MVSRGIGGKEAKCAVRIAMSRPTELLEGGIDPAKRASDAATCEAENKSGQCDAAACAAS